MIVITRNGETTVYRGWRAWLIAGLASIAAAAVIVVVAFLMLGLAITLAAFLLFVVPVAIVLAFIASRFQSPRPR